MKKNENGGREGNRGLLIFWSVPTILLALGITLHWDLGIQNPFEKGIELGLLFCAFYFGIGGAFWLLSKIFSWNHEDSAFWKAGLFGLLQIPFTLLLSVALFELFIQEPIPGLPLDSEDELRLGLFFVLYLPAISLGFFSLVRRGTAQGTISESGGPSIYAEIPIEGEKSSTEVMQNITSKEISIFSKLGLILPPLLTLLVLGALLGLQSPDWRNYLLAKICLDFGSPKQSLKFLNKAISLNEKLPPALHLKGIILLSARDPQDSAAQATKLIETASDSSPKNVRYLLSLSLAYQSMGLATDALNTISKAVDLSPRESILWSRKGDLLLELNNRNEAIEAYRKVIEITPTDAKALNNLSFTLLELDQNKGEALDLARESVRLRPGYVFNLDTLAWALYKNGDFAESYEIMKQVKSSASGSAEIDVHYSVIANELGILVNSSEVFEGFLSRKDVTSNPHLKEIVLSAIASSTKKNLPLPELPLKSSSGSER